MYLFFLSTFRNIYFFILFVLQIDKGEYIHSRGGNSPWEQIIFVKIRLIEGTFSLTFFWCSGKQTGTQLAFYVNLYRAVIGP